MATTEAKQNIPKGWRKVSLESLATKLKTGGTPTSTNKNFYGGNIPFVKIDDMTTSGKYLSSTISFLSNEGLGNSSAWIVPKGSILYSIYATVGEVSINSIDVATNQAIMGIIVNEKEADRDYLYQYLLSIKPSLRKHFKETTQKNLTSQIVRGLEILVPESKKEQKKIAEILGMVDEEIQKTNEIIFTTGKLKRGLMQQLFTRGIGHTKFKKTTIGEIPIAWDLKKLQYVCDFTTGRLNSNKAVEGGQYPFFTCAQETYQIDTYSFDQKAILLAGNNAAGKYSVKYFEGKFDAYQRTYVISVKDEKILDYFFLKEFLNTQLNELRNYSVGTNTQFLTIKLLNNLLMPLPDIDEQKNITAILSSVNAKIFTNQKIKAKLTLLKKGLMQDLLSGKVRTSDHFADTGKMIK